MKKIIKICIIILFLFCIVWNLKKAFLKHYVITYKREKFLIKEYYEKTKKHLYTFVISDKDNQYIFQLEHNFHKKKKIIKKIKAYESNQLKCITPIYKKNIDKNYYCILDKKQVSSDYLVKSHNKDFLSIQRKIKNESIKLPRENNIPYEYKKMKIYQKNILKDDIYYIWNYKGIDVISNNNIKTINFIKEDIYDDILSVTINNYFILLDNTSVEGIKKIYYYDVKKNKINVYKPKIIISKDSYINGTIDEWIYITDKEEKKQYRLNIKKEKIERIDQDETAYITYKNNKKIILSKSDFFMKEQYFTNQSMSDSKISISDDIREKEKIYYFIEDNKMYQSFKINPYHKILLFELNDIKEWSLLENEIMILQNDTIYSYDDQAGLRKILQSNELKYNYKNIYKLGKK